VPAFVTDSTVLIPGLLDPETLERKLLVLCAYGRLLYYESFGNEELVNNPQGPGSVVGGKSIAELQQQAGERAASLAERLPGFASNDLFLLMLSTPILDAFEAILRRNRVGAGFGVTAAHAKRWRVAAASLTTHAQPISLGELPQHTRDRDVDALLETAVITRAEFLVSDSPRLESLHGSDVDHGRGSVRSTRVCSFESFIMYTEIEDDLDEVDGSLLHLALGLM
jgi:predicted nucleic acid-binding protein